MPGGCQHIGRYGGDVLRIDYGQCGKIYIGNESSQNLVRASEKIDWSALKLFTLSRLDPDVLAKGRSSDDDHDDANIVQIYELGSANGDEYIVMEFVPGCTLAELIREKRLSINEALVCSHRITSALAAAHAAGIVHRDIKPGNIIANGDFTVVKILDFGLAKSEVKTRKPRAALTTRPAPGSAS